MPKTNLILLLICAYSTLPAIADDIPTPVAELQPLAANVARLIDAYQYLGTPFSAEATAELQKLIRADDAVGLQKAVDRYVLFAVSINPELRVKVQRGLTDPVLQQGGFTPFVVKVLNDATVTRRLNIGSPQAGPVYAGVAESTLKRQAQTELMINDNKERHRRFLEVEMFEKSPMTSRLSGLNVEYLVALVHSSEAGQREATISFDIGQGTQDLGFRSEVPVLFSVQPAVPVKLRILDFDGTPTTARLEFRDRDGRVYPPQAKRLAPDFFFQPHIYRADGEVVMLPPGEFTLTSLRGPEYHRKQQAVVVQADDNVVIEVQLERWVNPAEFGFYSGDHHIHAAGCSHYDNPTQGVSPQDMFAQVKGEGLNVGCVLTWGPCFDHQRTYFSPIADTVSEDKTILKYDLEISGFGSAALGHVCLLNLNNQTYPGSDGRADKGWPKWTVPVMKWAKQQGGITGYPHSALHVEPQLAAEWLLEKYDADNDRFLAKTEAAQALLPDEFENVDTNSDSKLSVNELTASSNRMADTLPNYALPSLNGGGAMEIFVSTSEGVCDFISAMDTARIPEWNTWYHLLNCGYPLKLSGETDFPCMSSLRVGQGRVYVQLGDVSKVDFTAWCQGIAGGQSYVSDGFAHALEFSVNNKSAGTDDVIASVLETVKVKTTVAFAPEQPTAVAYGTLMPSAGRRMTGDTVNLHAERNTGYTKGGTRRVEVIMNGEVVAAEDVIADGKAHDLEFDMPVAQSSWIAIRQFPQLHTNPVNVIVDKKPIRSNPRSAQWCAESVRLLWHNRRRFMANEELPAAKAAYEAALSKYFDIADQASAAPRTLRFDLE
jgi:hypothetical protein